MNASDPSETLERGRLAILIMGQSILAGAVVVLVFALRSESFASGVATAAIGLIVGGAAVVVGGLLGFLFGVPRSEAVPSSSPDGNGNERRVAVRYKPNTNLEQISDWLTKILVGVGLTQIGEAPALLGALADTLGPALGGGSAGGIFGAGSCLYFSTCGFLLGFLWTRIYMAGVLQGADGSSELFAQAIAAIGLEIEHRGNPETLRQVRTQLQNNLESRVVGPKEARKRIKELAERYERTRTEEAPGPARTLSMSAIGVEISALAKSANYDAQTLRTTFQASEGGRFAALTILQVTPLDQCFDLVETAITTSLSAFEQSVALRTAEILLLRMSPKQRKALKSAVEDQMADKPGSRLDATAHDRLAIAKRILEKLSRLDES